MAAETPHVTPFSSRFALAVLVAGAGASCATGGSTATAGGTGGTGAATMPESGGGGTGATGGTTTTTAAGCQGDIECPGAVCDLSTGACVPCTPSNDICPLGYFCTSSNQCQVGCNDDADCSPMTECHLAQHACVGCVID